MTDVYIYATDSNKNKLSYSIIQRIRTYFWNGEFAFSIKAKVESNAFMQPENKDTTNRWCSEREWENGQSKQATFEKNIMNNNINTTKNHRTVTAILFADIMHLRSRAPNITFASPSSYFYSKYSHEPKD